MNLKHVSIGIKTFLRDSKLMNTIQAIRDTMPEANMLITDCGDETEEKDGIYADLQREGHKVILMDFDAGFGAMSNAIVDSLERQYLLIASDDFDFRPLSVRKGILDLVEVLDCGGMDIASGRVGQHGPYEFDLEDLGDTIIEHPIQHLPHGLVREGHWFTQCDLTVNYCLVNRRVFEKVRWDDDVKIGGGEHGAWFLDVKRAGFKVAWVPGVSINEQEGADSQRYNSYRARSADPRRPCFDKRGIRKYVLGCGVVDYNAPVNSR